MPAPTTVTREQIVEAGRQLAAQGQRVTGWSLRTLLKTGRASRLEEVWAAHVAETAEETQVPSAAPLPAALEEHASALQKRVASEVDSLVATIWQVAERIATERTRTEIEAARDAAARTTSDLEAAEQAIVDAEIERDHAVASVEQLRLELREARADADRQRGHAEAADSRAQRAEVAAAAALEAARRGAEERGRLLERMERAEADLQARKTQRARETGDTTAQAVD